MPRPRLAKKIGRVYTPLSNQKALFNELSKVKSKTYGISMIIDTYIYFDKLKKKTIHPIDRCYGDEDNLRKALLDGLVKYEIIKDDSLVIGGENFKIFDIENWSLIKIWSADLMLSHM